MKKEENLEVEVRADTSWKRALNAARRTAGKKELDKEPSEKWKEMSMMAEHSQIKLVEYRIAFANLRQWVGVHLLRHEHVLPFIHSQREDRRELAVPRDELPQGAENDQDFYVNAQTLINMSRKRLCGCASPETRAAWRKVKERIAELDPTVARFMVTNCIYRGFCPEMKCCGFVDTDEFTRQLAEYRGEYADRRSETEKNK